MKKTKKKRQWDRYELYEKSVQEPEADSDFLDQAWREKRGRLCRTMREDFCGTAINAIDWVKRRRTNRAIAVDLDPGVLAVAEQRVARRLKREQRTRIELVQADVRKVKTEPVESVVAFNFSYWLFKTRDEMRGYFRSVHRSLVDGGLFFLDAYGGSDAFKETQEKRKVEDFTYIWDQSYYNPVTGDAINHIHFRLPDGTTMKKAFTYEWRLWTLPELRELLVEAGFSDVTVYWEGTDEETGEGDGVFAATIRGEACEGWIAYLVACKG